MSLAIDNNSKKEILDKLSKKFSNLDLIELTIQKLEDNNLINDARFSEHYVAARKRKGFGPKKISYELLSKGVESFIANEAISESGEWEELAHQVFNKKFRDGGSVDFKLYIDPSNYTSSRLIVPLHEKFNTLDENLKGKRVIMIDDSLVRGTTAGRLVALLRDAGATEVHVRITCPPITHACHFGVDMGHDDDLISSRLALEELRKEIGCDSLAFLSLEGMMKAVGKEDGYCNACFTGAYPITITKRLSKGMFDQVLA